MLHVLHTGSGGLESLKVQLAQAAPHQDSARFGLLNVENKLLLWSFLPEESLSGVKRARSLVHQRTLASHWKHTASISISNVDALSWNIVRSKLRLDGSSSSSLPPSPSMPQQGFPSRTTSPNPQTYNETLDVRPPALPAKDYHSLRSSNSLRSNSPTNSSPRPSTKSPAVPFAQQQQQHQLHAQSQSKRISDITADSPIFSTMTSDVAATEDNSDDDLPLSRTTGVQQGNGLSIHNIASLSAPTPDKKPGPLPSPIALPAHTNPYSSMAPYSPPGTSSITSIAPPATQSSRIAPPHINSLPSPAQTGFTSTSEPLAHHNGVESIHPKAEPSSTFYTPLEEKPEPLTRTRSEAEEIAHRYTTSSHSSPHTLNGLDDQNGSRAEPESSTGQQNHHQWVDEREQQRLAEEEEEQWIARERLEKEEKIRNEAERKERERIAEEERQRAEDEGSARKREEERLERERVVREDAEQREKSRLAQLEQERQAKQEVREKLATAKNSGRMMLDGWVSAQQPNSIVCLPFC